MHRGPANRFDAMPDTLRLLRQQGFAPAVVVDIGANVGTWTDMAHAVFAAREYHIVEPQTACHAALARFAPPRFIVHRLALTSEGAASVRMVGTGPDGNTGAWVATAIVQEPTVEFPATSLDELLTGRLTPADRPLLKLDVECHELAVLGAGTAVLAAAEVVITEFQMYPIENNGMPVLADVIRFMTGRDFLLYDVAALAGRPRDGRMRRGDVVFVHRRSPLVADNRWV